MRPATGHADVHLLFEPDGHRFRLIVLDAPVRPPGPRSFDVPFMPYELDALLARLAPRPRGTGRSDGATGEDAGAQAARTIGGKLFDAVFAGELGACLEASLAAARARGAAGIRLRLQLGEHAELASLPWELLYDRHRDVHLALSVATPVVRTLGLAGEDVARTAGAPLAEPLAGPLRVLVLVAGSGDHERLDAEREWRSIGRALTPLTATGLVAIDRVDGGSLAALARHLRRDDYHVVHYIGHGGHDRATGEGVLALEDADDPGGPARLTTGRDLGVLLRDQRALRLVVLNACEGAAGADVGAARDRFGGAAAALVRTGVPAVVAMQFAVGGATAEAFGGELYESLAGGAPLDVAVVDARKAVFAGHHGTDWAAPVLHLRGADVALVDPALAAAPARPATLATIPGGARDHRSPRQRPSRRERVRSGAVVPIALATAALGSVMVARSLASTTEPLDVARPATSTAVAARIGDRVDVSRVLWASPGEARAALTAAGYGVVGAERRSGCEGTGDDVVVAAVYRAGSDAVIAAVDPTATRAVVTEVGSRLEAGALLQLAVEPHRSLATCTDWATAFDPAVFARSAPSTSVP